MDSGNELMIRLEGISKVFHTDQVETHALEDVHLELRRGEYLAVSGPSGCGKTTLLSLLGLLESPTSGSFHLQGVDVSRLGATARARTRNQSIGFVFQSFNLIGDLTIFDNVELPLLYGKRSPVERKALVEEALERVGMSHRARHLPGQLSGGQQQRIAVARAVVGKPLILLADEPTGNLDSRNGEGVMQLLAELNQAGSTICMVTHDPRYATYAQRSVSLFDGRIVAEQVAAAVTAR